MGIGYFRKCLIRFACCYSEVAMLFHIVLTCPTIATFEAGIKTVVNMTLA